MCSDRYGDESNTVHAQQERLSVLRQICRNYSLDGIQPPRLDLRTVLASRASLKSNTAGGTDDTVVEMWKCLPMILVLIVWQLFQSRISSGIDSLNDHWRSIDLVGLPKVNSPVSIKSDFRYVAKSPILQKWYLKCVLKTAVSKLCPSALHVYGFRRGSGTALVTELIRQALHLAVQWGRSVYVIPLDIAMAFDAMLHNEMAQALLHRGVHPCYVHALILEYLDLRARVKLADAEESDWFPYRKGGRQGGVETPEAFNLMLEDACSDLVEEWNRKQYGFTLDDQHFLNHAVWADNFFLFAKTPEEAETMVTELSIALYRKGFKWKPSSIECLSSANVAKQLAFSFKAPDGTSLEVKAVDHLIALGVLLDRCGSTEASLGHGIARADKAYYLHVRVLSKQAAGVSERLHAFLGSAGQALLYNACGWHLTEHILTRLKQWENNKLRKVFHMRRAPHEDRAAEMLRTGQRLQTWFEKCGALRLHQQALFFSVTCMGGKGGEFQFALRSATFATTTASKVLATLERDKGWKCMAGPFELIGLAPRTFGRAVSLGAWPC